MCVICIFFFHTSAKSPIKTPFAPKLPLLCLSSNYFSIFFAYIKIIICFCRSIDLTKYTFECIFEHPKRQTKDYSHFPFPHPFTTIGLPLQQHVAVWSLPSENVTDGSAINKSFHHLFTGTRETVNFLSS